MSGNFEKGAAMSSNVVFDVETSSSKTKKPIPTRFEGYQKKTLTKKDLEDKQKEAENRRKAYEKAKLDRIKEVNDECIRIDSTAQLLLAQDAKRRGLPGTENIKPMSSRDAAKAVKTLSQDFGKLTHNISSHTDFKE